MEKLHTYVLRRLDTICERRGILKVFDKNQDVGKSIMGENDNMGALNSTWPKDSNDDLFVKSFKHECMPNFDPLVLLKLLS